jgi:hypothetical protein
VPNDAGCRTQDFIRIDTRNVTTAEGTRQFRFAVIGNPCDRPDVLRVRQLPLFPTDPTTRLLASPRGRQPRHRPQVPFQQSFGWGETTLHQSAPEVRFSGIEYHHQVPE